MPVSRRRKPKPPREPPRKSDPPKRKWWKGLFETLLAIATLVGVPAAIWPRMTVTASGLFDDSNAYSETFLLTNTGFQSLKDVQVGIGICSIETLKHDFSVAPRNCEGDCPRLMVGGPPWFTRELKRDETFSIVLSDGLNVATDKYRAAHPNVVAGYKLLSELKGANIIVDVRFRHWLSLSTNINDYRFVVEEQPNGKVMWRAVPLSWRLIKLPE